MIEITGTYNTAKIFTEVVEENAAEQIKQLCDQEFVNGCKIRIMPDVHAGAGCVIGFTADLGEMIIPNIVGVDIGCGMLTVELGKADIDFSVLDGVIRAFVPSGKNVHEGRMSRYPELQQLYCYRNLKKTRWIERSLRTLGGGNYFIEIDVDDENNKYLVIHTGSRNLGKQVAELYQQMAYDICRGADQLFEKQKSLIEEYKATGRRSEIQTAIKQMKAAFRAKETDIPKELCYLTGEYKDRRIKLDAALKAAKAEWTQTPRDEPIPQELGLRWNVIEQTLNELVDFSDSKISREIINKFMTKITPKGNNRYAWFLNLDDGITEEMTTASLGKKNNAIIFLDDKGGDGEPSPPIHNICALKMSISRMKSGFSDDLLLVLQTADSGLCSSQAGDRHAVRRARNIVQTDIVAELNGARVAAMLAADAKMNIRAGGAAKLGCHLYQFANTLLIESCKRVVLVNLLLIVSVQELTSIVTAEAEGHLGQIVGAEAEELGLGRDFVRSQSGTRNLNHGADMIFQLNAGSLNDFISGFDNDILDIFQLFDFADKRNHNFRHNLISAVSLINSKGCFDNRAGLHRGDFRVGNRQTAATVTHHRVELMQRSDNRLNLLNGLSLCIRKQFDILLFGRNKLMQRRIQEADGYALAFHSLIQLLKVALLHRLQLCQRSLSLLNRIRADHLADRGNSVGIEEHMLGTAEADALGAERGSLLSILRGVRIGADLEGSVFIGKLHNSAEFAAD